MNRILVVEDNEDIRSLVVSRVTHAGYAVKAAVDGAEALGVCAADPLPDVLVLDVGLPDVDGFTLLSRIRELPGCNVIPAIFLSARVQEADILRGRELVAEYLTKPFVASALIRRIQDSLAVGRQSASW